MQEYDRVELIHDRAEYKKAAIEASFWVAIETGTF